MKRLILYFCCAIGLVMTQSSCLSMLSALMDSEPDYEYSEALNTKYDKERRREERKERRVEKERREKSSSSSSRSSSSSESSGRTTSKSR